jgi:hypothetical protein
LVLNISIVVQRGVCYDPTTEPPSVPGGAEKFVLCCLGKTIRPGNGQLCLRYNYSTPYNVYSLDQVGFPSAINVTVSKNGNETITFILNNQDMVELPEAMGTAIVVASPAELYAMSLAGNAYFFQAGYPQLMNDWRNWFWWLKQLLPSRLQISASQWRSQATCNRPLNFLTMTHNGPDTSDQFAQLRTNTLEAISGDFNVSSLMFVQNQPPRLTMALNRKINVEVVLNVADISVQFPFG